MTAQEMLEALAKQRAQRNYDPDVLAPAVEAGYEPDTTGIEPFGFSQPLPKRSIQEDIQTNVPDFSGTDSSGDFLSKALDWPPSGAQAVPNSDESSGRPLAAPTDGSEGLPLSPPSQLPPGAPAGQLGVSPVPPPVPTSQPVVAPGEQPPAAPVTELDKYRRDPNEVLREAYKPAIDMAMKAMHKDLQRGTGLGANALGWALMSKANPEVQASGAGIVGRAQTSPINTELMEKAGKAGQEWAKLQVESAKLDPTSEISQSARLAFHSSDQFKSLVENAAKSQGIDFHVAATQAYKMTKGLSVYGLGAFMDVMKASNDYSKGRAEIAKTYAEKSESEARAHQLQVETSDKEALYKAWNNPNSEISRTAQSILLSLSPAGTVDPDRARKLSAHEIHSQFPRYMEVSSELLKWHNEYNIGLKADTMVDGETQVRTEEVPGPVPGMPAKRVANPVGVKPEAKREYIAKRTASQVGLESADDLLKMISGPENTISYAVQSPEGQTILKRLAEFARSAAIVAPEYGQALMNEITNQRPDGTFVPSQFLFGAKGKKASVVSTLSEMNRNMRAAHTPYVNEQVQTFGNPPPTPPMYMPMEIVNANTIDANLKGIGYVFTFPTSDGNSKKVIYQREKSGIWRVGNVK